jgi:hypothetical protein
MERPRLIYYNDGHHFHAKRVDPPLTMNKLRWPVDEVLATGVDLLVMGLGYGDVYFHQSKVGRTVGEAKDVWESYIDWRIMRMVEDAEKMGTDQIKETVSYARGNGMGFFPSLKLQDTAKQGGERSGWLKEKHGQDVCLGGPDGERNAWAYDFTNELVQENKLAIVREMLDVYGADGIELDFMFYPAYFRPGEIGKGVPVMNDYVARIRQIANEIGERQGREIPIMARVFHRREDNLGIGLDVETWLSEGNVDMVVGQVSDFLFDTGLSDARWMAEAANDANAAAYIRPPRHVYDERTLAPHIEMYRALAQTLEVQGFAGMYLGYLAWPFASEQYQILREAALPQSMSRRNKRYVLQPGESQGGGTSVEAPRQLPADLIEGETLSVVIHVADDVATAIEDQEIRKPVLNLRFTFFCIEDDIEFRFNGTVLSRDEAEITDERAMHMPPLPKWHRGEVYAPGGASVHWFKWRLDPAIVVQGENVIEIDCKGFEKRAGFTRNLNGVEVWMRYKQFERPEGLGMPRIASRTFGS